MTAANYIYGAGRMGREMLAHRRAVGLRTDAFVDRSADKLIEIDGLPVVAPDAVRDAQRSEIVVALHSPAAAMHPVVGALRGHGFATVETLWSACRRAGWMPAAPFWLDVSYDWVPIRDDVARARALFTDPASVAVFDEMCRLREHGDYASLSTPTPRDQYTPKDLPRWNGPLRLIDCGAYDGDTLRAFAEAGYRIAEGIALEPDPANHERLVASLVAFPTVRALRVGAYRTSGTLRFAANGSGSAHVTSAGETVIDVVAIDDLCEDFAPTLVKMDIEGAERAALEGATRTLARHRPALAISVYHAIDDLWRIPLWIHDLGLGYRFALRSHAFNGFDSVLYARVEA